MQFSRVSCSLMIAACLAPLLASDVATAQPAPRLVIFGDSLSDSGNFFAATGEAVHIPVEPIPSAPYAIGGHHFSNGATWIEQLATRIGANPSANPAVVNPRRFTNYAFGRARARANAPAFDRFDLATQVTTFLSDFQNTAPSNATYVIWIGANDARDAFTAGGDPGIAGAAITAIADSIGLLVQRGARRFVVLNVPDIGLLPAVAQLPTPIPAQATAFTGAFNQALSAALDAVEQLVILPSGGQLTRVDTFQILHDIAATPGAWGLDNVTESCLSFNGAPFMCRHPRTYLFWDGGHPTTAGHAILADRVYAMLP